MPKRRRGHPTTWYCRTTILAQKRADYQRNGTRRRNWFAYKLTHDQYEAMVRQCQGRCELCRRETKQLHVDHDHDTGAIRGLLCQACNFGLGYFRDNPEVMRRAARYVEATPAQPKEMVGTAVCAYCLARVRVRADGTCWRHYRRAAARSPTCSGSGRPPKPGSAEEEPAANGAA